MASKKDFKTTKTAETKINERLAIGGEEKPALKTVSFRPSVEELEKMTAIIRATAEGGRILTKAEIIHQALELFFNANEEYIRKGSR